MATNSESNAANAKRIGIIWIAVIVALLGVGVIPLAREAIRRSKIAADAVRRVDTRGQEIVNAAFPGRIGAAPYQGASVEGVTSTDDGYQVVVTLYYTNIVNDKNFMQITASYDSTGTFRDARISRCNDRWATPVELVDIGKR